MIILIDCDDVMANFREMAIKVIRDEFGIEVKNSMDDWDIFESPEIREKRSDIWDYLLTTPGLFRNLEKFEYADEMVAKLREVGHLICCTSMLNGLYAGERVDWLIEEMGFSHKDIILAYRKELVCGDVFIDDKPANVVNWARGWFIPEQCPHCENGTISIHEGACWECMGEGWVKSSRVPVLWQAPGRAFTVENEDIFATGNVNELIERIKG